MSSLVYALNIATLALWLSVTGLDVVGWVMPIWHAAPKSSRSGETAAVLKPPEISLGAPEQTAGDPETVEPAPAPAPAPEALPAPPALPAISEFAPLPDLPELPSTRAASPLKTAAMNPAAKPTRRAEAQPAARGDGAAAGQGRGLSSAARLAAGHMPAPVYPADARRRGQSGSVLIEFVVGADGSVLAAYPKQPSPWPSLDNEAVRTVRRWKFPPGGVMTLQRQIDFELK